MSQNKDMILNTIEQALIDEDVYFYWDSEPNREVLCIDEEVVEQYRKFERFVTIRAVKITNE